jgi:undecaprenyl-diphosphatase
MASVIGNFPGEVAASTWVQSWQTPWLDSIMKAVSAAGDVPVAGATVLLVALALLAKGLKAEAGLVVGATIVGYAVRVVAKAAVARPRPAPELVELIEQAEGYSFPSGHVMLYVVFLGTIAFVMSWEKRQSLLHRLVLTAALVAILVVGLSRIYLGVHWLGDVIAGYAFGAVIVGAAVWAWGRWSGDAGPSRKTGDSA